MAEEQHAEAAETNITAVNVKLPSFWPTGLHKFDLRKLRCSSRQEGSPSSRLITFLAPEYATELCDQILHHLAQTPYDTQETADSVHNHLGAASLTTL